MRDCATAAEYVFREMPCSARNVVTDQRGAFGGQWVIARRTRGSTDSFFGTGAVDRPPGITDPADSPKCHHQHPQRHRCLDTEPSPMSCDMTGQGDGVMS